MLLGFGKNRRGFPKHNIRDGTGKLIDECYRATNKQAQGSAEFAILSDKTLDIVRVHGVSRVGGTSRRGFHNDHDVEECIGGYRRNKDGEIELLGGFSRFGRVSQVVFDKEGKRT